MALWVSVALGFWVGESHGQDSPPHTENKSHLTWETLRPPHDLCLPARFNDWKEAAQYDFIRSETAKYVDLRIMIDRASYTMVFQGLTPEGEIEELYRSPVGLGRYNAMTPVGLFHINHIYCYPDVKYFTDDGSEIDNLYNGLFAPLLICDSQGVCSRYEQLGLHGLNPELLPGADLEIVQRYGPVSEGCVRLPDPCGFKREIISHAGIGPLMQNQRGHYHWLRRSVSVEVVDEVGWSLFSSVLGAIGGLLDSGEPRRAP